MSILDSLRRPDIKPTFFVKIQSIPENWAYVDVLPGVTGVTKSVIVPGSLELRGPQVKPFEGIGMAGGISLNLCDPSGYLAALVGPGVETFLASQIEPDSTSFEIEDATGISDDNPLHVHTEAISFTLAGITATITARNVDDLLGYPGRHTWKGPEEGAGRGQAVRVGTTPYVMAGRRISVFAIDGNGEFGEVWRGKITSWPDSADDVNFSLEASTFEAAIVDSAPLCGFQGRVASGAKLGQFSTLIQQPVLVQAGRNRLTLDIYPEWYVVDGDTVIQPGLQDTVFCDVEPGWHTLASLAAAMDKMYYADSPATWTGFTVLWQDTAQEGTGQRRLEMCPTLKDVYVPEEEGAKYGFDYVLKGELWAQLGFVNGAKAWSRTTYTDGAYVHERSFALAQEPTAQVCILPGDAIIPAIVDGDAPPAPGTILIGEEAVSYQTALEEAIGGERSYLLGGCSRACSGTKAVAIEYRYGTESGDLPSIESACLVGALAPEPYIWAAIVRLLTGIGIAGGWNGALSTQPGLGIAEAHIDTLALLALVQSPGNLPAVQGVVRNVKKFINDAMALEGYALVGVSDGTTFKLRPIWMDALRDNEETRAVRMAMAGQRGIRGGEGEIVNVLTLNLPDDTSATYYDDDSIQTFGAQEPMAYELPMSGSSAAYMVANVVTRMFHLRGRKSIVVADVEVAPEGRFSQPGEVVQLTWPRVALCGDWRVMACNQPLAGNAPTKMTCFRIKGAPRYIYAPTCGIASAFGSDLTLDAGQGMYFTGATAAYMFPPDDYGDGQLVTISAVVGDVLTVDDIGLAEDGWFIEPVSHEHTEYAYIDDTTPAVWGT
jgi:hypothetical protein